MTQQQQLSKAVSAVVLSLVLAIPLLITAFMFGPAALDLVFHRRPPDRYLIPAGYSGWVRIDFRQNGAPSLAKEGRYRVLKVNGDGTLRTSSSAEPGHGSDEFFYYSSGGLIRLSNAGVCKGGMIWEMETTSQLTRFFVGSEDQYRHEVDPAGKAPACE